MTTNHFSRWSSNVYHAPLHVYNFLNKDSLENKRRKYTLRIIDHFLKKDLHIVKLQVINTRATLDLEISSLIESRSLLILIDPFCLFELGYHYKSNNNPLKHKCLKKNFIHSFLENCVSKIVYPFRKDRKYGMRVEQFENETADIKIVESSFRFEVPLEELKKDFFLLSNIEPYDLIGIGYSTKERELKRIYS